MNLPFSIDQFLSVFEQYNQAVWPIQIILNLLALAAVLLTIKRSAPSNRIITWILAFLWIWIGLAYHMAFFASINPAAYVFGALNIVQGILFLAFGIFTQRLSFRFRPDAFGITGAVLILYALVAYPLLGYALGHIYPRAPTFGLPCPTTIFTFGLLLWTDIRVPWSVLIIPLLWSLLGFTAAFTLGIFEDTGLLIAGIVGLIMILVRDMKGPKVEAGVRTVP